MAVPARRLFTWTSCLALATLGIALPLFAQTAPTRTTPRPAAARTAAAPRPAATVARTTATPRAAAASRPSTPVAATRPTTPAIKTNPFLPAPILVDAFFADLTLSPKAAPSAPQGYAPLVSAKDWQSFREHFGTDLDNLSKLKPSAQIAFAQTLIDAAAIPAGPEVPTYSPDFRRLVLLRAAAIAYRTTAGFPTADKAVLAYLELLDKKSPAQVGALWSIANIMARTSVTPKPDRIRYDAIAAKANMQLALIMLQCDQLDAAQAIIKQIAYHEGWLKSDPATRALIAQARAEVRQSAAMLDYLATQYQPAIRNDVSALTAVYLYGRYVKGNLAVVADIPPRVPDSPLAHLARSLDAASRGDLNATFTAAESLRLIAAGIPDARLRSRTLYAAMQLYDTYMAAPATERERIQRTLARIAREGTVADGARKANTLDPFAPPPPTTAPAPRPATPARPAAPARTAVAVATP